MKGEKTEKGEVLFWFNALLFGIYGLFLGFCLLVFVALFLGSCVGICWKESEESQMDPREMARSLHPKTYKREHTETVVAENEHRVYRHSTGLFRRGCCKKQDEEATSTESLYPEQTINELCPICLDDFLEGAQVNRLACQHTFHIPCLQAWIELRHLTCPLCRGRIRQ